MQKAITFAKGLDGAKGKMERDEPEVQQLDTTSPIQSVPGAVPGELPPVSSSPQIAPPPLPTPTGPPPGGETLSPGPEAPVGAPGGPLGEI